MLQLEDPIGMMEWTGGDGESDGRERLHDLILIGRTGMVQIKLKVGTGGLLHSRIEPEETASSQATRSSYGASNLARNPIFKPF